MELLKKIIKIISAKKVFKKPNKKKIFIFDENIYRSGYEHILNKNECFAFETRYKELYFTIYLKSVLIKIFSLSKLPIFKIYTIEIIKAVNPKYIICFAHYVILFWDLKQFFKDKIFIMCQHHILLGYDGKYHPNVLLEGKQKFSKKNKIDHIFLWGDAMTSEFKKYFDGNFYNCGSIKNNSFKNKLIENEKNLVFMSQYHNWLNTSQLKIPLEDGSTILKYNMNLKERKIVLNILHDYCKENNLDLVIAPRQFNKKDYFEEKEYYEKILDKKDFIFLERSKQFQVYEEFNKFKYFAVIDCSTGYEAMARGKRVAHLNVVYDLNRVHGGRNNRFGWPGNFDLKGPFWTNKGNKEEIFRCLNFIFEKSNTEWEIIKKDISTKLLFLMRKTKNLKKI